MQKNESNAKSINLVELWNATDIMTFLSTLKEVNQKMSTIKWSPTTAQMVNNAPGCDSFLA